MQGHYADLISEVGEKIAGTVLDRDAEPVERARFLDGDVAELLRQIGQVFT